MKMPAGVSWGQYLGFASCALLSMMAGSQLVHTYYKPLQDLEVYIDRELENTKKLTAKAGGGAGSGVGSDGGS